MNIAQGIALVLLSAIYYPFIAPILTFFWMFGIVMLDDTEASLGFIWSLPFLIASGEAT